MSVLQDAFFGNTVQQWLVAAAVLVGVAAGLRLAQRFLAWRLGKLATRTATQVDDLIAEVLGRTKLLFSVAVALYFAGLTLDLPAEVQTLLLRIVVIGLVIQGGIWTSAAIRSWVARTRDRMLEEDAASATTMSALSFVGRLLVWLVVLLLILDNLEVDITALVTGLGIGGIAVALAVQNILGDLFASLSIVLDKPFAIGDFLNVDGFLGRVEHIGLKTTRVRSLSGEQLIFSNADLLQSRIRNFGRMFERRVLFTFGVTYQTPRDKVARIPEMIREIIESREMTRFDRSHFKEYGDFSLVIETVYFVLSPDYNAYMDIQQAVNLEIGRRFEEEGIEFAYPTRTIYHRALDGSAAETAATAG